MRAILNKMPKATRKNSFFSTFKDTKRARWAESRNYNS